MSVDFEVLDLLPKIYDEIQKKNSPFLSVEDASKYLSVSVPYLRKKIDNEFIEKIHFYRVDRRILFDKKALEEWVRN